MKNLAGLNIGRKQKMRQPIDTKTPMFAKVPPQARDVEEAVLGAIMLEKTAFEIVSERIQAGTFYVDSNQRIFAAMTSLAKKSMPIDLLTVKSELELRNELDMIGGGLYLSKLTNAVVSSANLQTHAIIILQKYMLREIIRIGNEMVLEGYEQTKDVFELLDQLETDVLSIALNNLKKDFQKIDNGIVRFLRHLDELRNQESRISGITSGFKSLDEITHGWQKTDLIILAARPSVGKTAFALNLARNAALDAISPTPVGIFSLEMSEQQIIERLLSAETEIHLELIRRGRMNEEKMSVLYDLGVKNLSEALIFIDETPGLTLQELRGKAKRMKQKYGIGLVIIDYLQLMTGDSKNGHREQEVSNISRNLKKLAKELEIPIIALSQLSREVEKRGFGQKIPQLSDLRDSGAIEQDADLVMFLYRPPADEVKENADLENCGMIRIAKHRNGKLDDVVMKFYGPIQKWMEPETYDKFYENT